MQRKARLIPVPVILLRGAAQILHRGDVAQRLLGSLQVDITKARRVLDWTPPVTVDEGLRRAVRDLQ
jgi:nucleoside-diphosphate-sugar epimerase